MEKTKKQKTLTRKWEWLTKGLEGFGGKPWISVDCDMGIQCICQNYANKFFIYN